MDDLIANQQQVMAGMEQLLTNFKKDGPERRTSANINRKLSSLETYWQEFQCNHIKLCEFDDKTGDYFVTNAYKRTSDFYFDTRSYLQKYLSSDAKPDDKQLLRPVTPLATGGQSRAETPEARQQPPESSFQMPRSSSGQGAFRRPATPLATGGQTRAETQDARQQQQQQESSFHVPRSSSGHGTSSKLDEMLRKQQSNFKAFIRTLHSVNIENLSSKWEFEDTLKLVQNRWSVIDSLHWEIDGELYEDNLEYEQTYNRYERQFNDIKKSLNEKMWSQHHREKSTPQMDIPTFSGNYQQWVSFKDLFVEAVHSNTSLSNAQKMQFLKSKLKGEAEKLVQHLLITSDNYEVSWNILLRRYNNLKLIFNSHMNTLTNLPTLQQQSAAAIKKIYDTTNECLNAIKALGIDTSTWDPIVVYIISNKLDADTHIDYVESLKNPKELPTLSDLLDFLELKITSLETSRRKPEAKTQQQESSTNKKTHFFKSFTSHKFNQDQGSHNSNDKFLNKVTKCAVCNMNDHNRLFHCETFLEMPPYMRQKTVEKLSLCKNCLMSHNTKKCFSKKRCQECEGEHNTLLHNTSTSRVRISSQTQSNEAGSSQQSQQRGNAHVLQGEAGEILLATALVNATKADGTHITLRALIDQGSQTSLITENAAQILGMKRKRCQGIIFGVGAKEMICKGIIGISLSSLYIDYQINVEVFVMKHVVNNLPNQTFAQPTWPHLENIQLADPEFFRSRSVDLLLGADVYAEIILGGVIRQNPSMPIAQQTRFGWILCGSANVTKSYHCNVVLTEENDLHRFWSIEDIADQTKMSTEDLECLQLYKQTTEREADGRYIVRLPLHSDADEKLGKSRPKALAQFYQLERKFKKYENISNAYKSFMHEYQELGHMRTSTGDSNRTPGYYMPHHCVHRADSTTTALRVVFNASGMTSRGYSLNDVMYRGPNLQKDLLSLVLKWRQYKYAYVADIEKMFRQIQVHEDHQRYQKVVWRDSEDQAVQDFRLQTVTYGTKAAPFLAMMTLKQLASDEGHKFPAAAKVLEEQFYMDDLISGSHRIESAQELKFELTELLKLGGFNLRKWCSNELSLISNDNAVSKPHDTFDFRHQESTKTLGLLWKAKEDVFSYKCKMLPKSPSIPSKRILLSEISKIFDPLGWLSPVVIQLKLLFQDVWKSNLQWDDKVPEDIHKRWTKLREDIDNIDQTELPRWIGSGEDDVIQLHGFCDASSKAFAGVIYARVKGQDSLKITLLAAKTKVNPISTMDNVISLPKLELSGADLLAKLMIKVKESLNGHTIELYGWCDSTAVLGWLHGEPSRWKPFVANRVKKITEVMPAECWRYVKSKDNPADCATRGLTASQLQEHSLWWHGPTWLKSFKKDDENVKFDTDLEIKTSRQSVNTAQVESTHIGTNLNIVECLISKHSNFTRVTRVLAWIMRAITHPSCNRQQGYLTTDEIRIAKLKIIKCIQQLEFSDEIKDLQRNKTVSLKSKLFNMQPYLDEDGMLRVGGRLRNSNLSEEMKHPLIIPHTSHFTEMLIDHAHKQTFHGGARLTLSWLRQEYWIVGGNRAVKKRLQQCVICKRHNPVMQHQLMGDLPTARTNPTRPFHHTGVDFTGFIFVKSSKGRGIKSTKGYVSVFVCMVTKAIHLELVSDLSSSTFLAALRRFSARRGTPRHIYCDNGTNFVGANKILNKEFVELKSLLSDEFLSETNEMKIKFHFLAPSWPSAGGLWESGVKSLKYHLHRVVGEQKLTFEEFTTLLTQLEACLNSRPLSALSEDTDDIDYLTPSHFLASGPVLTIYETEKDERTRWQLTQKIFQDIWNRWRAEYLTQLLARSKWRETRPNIKLDDIVIIHDANLPAGKWILGRVIELHPGKDNHVRVISIKTKSGVLKRPIVKVSILPVADHVTKTSTDPKEQGSSAEPTRKKNTAISSCVNLMTMIFMLIMLCSTTAVQSAYNITAMQSNNSIYFDKVSDMRIIQDKWKLVVYYNMKPYWKGTNLLTAYNKHLEGLCSKFEGRESHCDIMLLQLRHGFSELQYYNDILQQSNKHARKRRGIIDGVGNIANSLFGVLDSRFAEQYENDITKVRHDQKHLVTLWKNQTSVIEAENNLLKRIEASMEEQHKVFIKHLNELEQTTVKLNDAIVKIDNINEFIMSSMIANNILNSLKNIQDALLETITNYKEFNVHLLTPVQLRDELSIISGQLSKDLSLPINNIQTDLAKIYKVLKVRARMSSQYLIFEIQIPLVNRDNYELYKTYPVPQRTQNAIVSITPIAAFLAINIEKDTYIPISDIELLQRCYKLEKTLHICELQKPVYQKASGENLCVRDYNNSQCRTTLSSCQPTWTELINVNNFMITCCGQCTARFICGYHVTQEQLTGVNIIALGNDCVIKGESFTITPHKQHASTLNTEPDLLSIEIAPVNNIINITIPITHFNESNSGIKDSIESINERIAEIKEAADHFEQHDEMSPHDIHQYVAIYAVAAAALVCAAIVWWRARGATATPGSSTVRATSRACAPPVPPVGTQPIPSTRAVLSSVLGNSVVCDESESACNVQSYSVKCERSSKDSATSPTFSKIRFISDRD